MMMNNFSPKINLSGLTVLNLLSIVLLITIFSATINAQVNYEFRGVKITDIDSDVMFDDRKIAEAMDFLAARGFNAVIPVVWNAGYTQYPSQFLQNKIGVEIDPQFLGRDPLNAIIIEAHRAGLEVYPWFEYGFASWYSGGTPPYGGHLIQQYPQWASKKNDGSHCTKNGFDWLSGINTDVQDLIIGMVSEVMTKYDIDGIEFSDRMPALPVECGYDSVTVEIYKSEHSGNLPPQDYDNAAWKRWRADKLNQFYARVRDTVYSKQQDVMVATSPSLYPWAYEEYLQDVPNWVNTGIADQFLPQLYRYDYFAYLQELNSTLSTLAPGKKDITFAGILMNVGSYTVSPSLLIQFMQLDRQKGLKGEGFFFYEGLRKNSNQLADTIRALFYSQPAEVPGRNNSPWRPKGILVNEDDAAYTSVTGNWQLVPILGYKPNVYRTNSADYAAISYTADVQADAWQSVYVYIVSNSSFTSNARYTVYHNNDSTVVIVDQKVRNRNGWVKLGDFYFKKGLRTVLKVDNTLLEPGKYLISDAMLMLLNRKLSPDVVITSADEPETEVLPSETDLQLSGNYPNPFNPATVIKVKSRYDVSVTLKVFNSAGSLVAESEHYLRSGDNELQFNGSNLASGNYFYSIRSRGEIINGKMVLLK
ncbi:MAG: family 10 glycosylhydrolase [Ignavibacteriaceae bacterium]|nr:family 10 glycosylhydrolase [Ignavibacteriaceae bacterium]